LAQHTVGLSLALLIQCLEWKRIAKKEVDMSEAKGITISRKNPLEVMCKTRESPMIMDAY